MATLKRLLITTAVTFLTATALLLTLIYVSAQYGFLWGLAVTSVEAILFGFVVFPRAFTEKQPGMIGAGAVLLVLSIWAIVGVANIGSWLIGEDPPQVEQVKTEYTDIDAYFEATEIVRKYLKAPSTAEFPYPSAAKIQRLENNGFRIDGYVDSQNSFGAMLRSEWTVLFQLVGNKQLRIYAVMIDGKVLVKNDPE